MKEVMPSACETTPLFHGLEMNAERVGVPT